MLVVRRKPPQGTQTVTIRFCLRNACKLQDTAMVIMVITIWRANKKPDNTSNVRDETGDSESGNSNILPRPRHSSQTPKIAIHDHPIPRPAPGAEKLFSKKYISGIYF